MVFIDTNIFVHFFTRDHPGKSADALRFLERIMAAEEEGMTSESVLAEVVWVLRSKTYEMSRADISEGMLTLLSLPGMKVENSGVFRRAFQLFADSKLDIADCLTLAHMERTGVSRIATYDRDFDRIDGIVRIEP